MAPKQSKMTSGSSQTSSSASASTQLQDLLRNMDEAGKTDEVLAILRQNFGTERVEDHGAMSDASKRRRSPAPSEGWEQVQYPQTSGGYSSGPMGTSESGQTDAGGIQQAALPEGIPSLTRWSETLCELPKVAKLNYSYAELVQASYQDESLKKYLLSYVLTFRGSSDRVKDLRLFLEAIGYTGSETPVLRYGSATSDIRRFKE